jgi:ribosomal protein S18 acetylase RimI-like enzyme
MTISIRCAIDSDIEQINSLYAQGDEYHVQLLPDIFCKCDKPRPIEIIEEWINGEDSDYLLAFNQNSILGFLNIKKSSYPSYPMFVQSHFAIIENCVVDEKNRRRRIGERLFNEAVRWAKAKGLESIQITVWNSNMPAMHFYEKFGFKPIHQRMDLKI